MTGKRTDMEMEADLRAMRRYARALSRDHVAADDVVQDAVMRAIERRDQFQPDRSRRRWLLAIVHNVFISAKRREAAETRRNLAFAQIQVDPDQEVRADLMQVARAFADLPDHQRAVMHLTVVEGLSYQESADLLGIAVGTVMSRLARARATLRQDRDRQPRDRLRIVGGQDE
ncbi:sigma-70 family RNA polymerase sigma factor [Sphingobium yanoikuyae]|uniref:sigma-70 family RNA polymerase sigma factor n=1 Tax=Sphingobium yanoikuyae TaxID=13690 RepID=UPI00289D16BA|nr:sigma-70 family RNA polymerase sigma factor [Sphingobium yanoikuyae]